MLGLSLHQYLPPIWLLASLPAFLLCYFFGLQDKFIQHHNPQLTIFSQHLLRAPWLWYSYTDLRECPLFELRGSYHVPMTVNATGLPFAPMTRTDCNSYIDGIQYNDTYSSDCAIAAGFYGVSLDDFGSFVSTLTNFSYDVLRCFTEPVTRQR